MKGRKTKPNHLKLLQGNPGKRKLKKGKAKAQAAEIPRPPLFLSKDAKLEWQRLAPKLHALNLLTHIDRGAFSAYCEAWATFKWANEEMGKATGLVIPVGGGETVTNKKNGDTVTSRKTVSYTTHPLLWVRNQAMQQMHKFLTEFGLSPASRSRIAAELPTGAGDSSPKDPYEAFKSARNN
jgi:P27 family predicted phage terminase small subunit